MSTESTGNDRQPVKVKRTYVLDGVIGEDGEVVQPRARAQQIVDDFMSAGWSVGGAIRIVFDRVKVGELPPTAPGAPREPLAETVGVVIEYQANTPLNGESMTARLLERAYAEEEEPAAAPVAGGLGDELEAMADTQRGDDDADGAGDDDEDEQGD